MINRAIIVGRLTSAPEIRYTQSGTAVLTFTIACQRNYVDKNGERNTDFIDCVAWRNTAEFISKYFAKGDAIGVEGRIETRMYQDKNGNKRKAVDLTVDQVTFIESKKRADTAPQNAPDDGYMEIDPDGDLPF